MASTHASSASSPTWFEISDLGQRQHRLRLGGFFGPTWMASLCAGVATHGLSILDAHAMRARDLSWMAELKLLAIAETCDPDHIPYLSLARGDGFLPTATLKLTSFELVETMDHGGTLRLTIEADDVLGLLGTLLTRLSELLLIPLEMHIETCDGHAHDRFWLSALNGDPPTRAMRMQLEALLVAAARG